MPHAGGGGHSGGGGFHSSGSHSNYSAKPRFDNQGRLHSQYYVRPGFYCHGHYIPYYGRDRRNVLNVHIISIILFVLALITGVSSIFVATSKGRVSEAKLNEYSMNTYADVYNPDSSNYEENILVTFVTHDNKEEYEYYCIIGDNVNSTVDISFGDFDSTFGSALEKNNPSENGYSNLYLSLSKSLDVVTSVASSAITTTEHTEAPTNSSIINKTELTFTTGESELKESINDFYKTFGYNITFVIDDNEDVYFIEWGIFAVLVVFSTFSIFCGVYALITKNKEIKEVEKAIKEGNAEKYFEGEDPFEEYIKSHPLDLDSDFDTNDNTNDNLENDNNLDEF